jgi:hypothetical protein
MAAVQPGLPVRVFDNQLLPTLRQKPKVNFSR